MSARFTSTVSANTSLQGRNDPNTHYHTHIQSIGTSNILFQMNIKNEFFVKCNIVSRNVHPNQCSSLYAVKCFTTVQHIQWDIFNLVMLIVPQAPEVFYREFETPFPSLWLRRSASTLDPIRYCRHVSISSIIFQTIFLCQILSTRKACSELTLKSEHT